MVGYIKSFEESQGGAPATWRAEFGGGKYQQKYGHSKVQKIYEFFIRVVCFAGFVFFGLSFFSLMIDE